MFGQIQESTDPAAVLETIWSELAVGVETGRHAFHTPALAISGRDGPSVRTVVLREADSRERLLICHTDIRSPKIALLRENPLVQWLFYDREQKTQLRISGLAELHHDDILAEQRWKSSRPGSRACYAQPLGPGEILRDSAAEAGTTMDGYGNFVVLRSRVEMIDWLYLRAGGHLRLRFDWRDGQWHAQRIAP